MNSDRYQMNYGVITKEEQAVLVSKKIVIVGLGGLGGNLANQLVRLGAINLILVDHDSFVGSNLNRQLFSNEKNIGLSKVEVVKEELEKINPKVRIEKHYKRVQNVTFADIDYIIDCVDNMETRVYLSQLSKQLNKPLLHGSCGGWYGQVGWVSPSSTIIDDMYASGKGLEKDLLNPAFTPALVASFMCSEFVKMIKRCPTMVQDELLLIDLYNNVLMKTGR